MVQGLAIGTLPMTIPPRRFTNGTKIYPNILNSMDNKAYT